MSIVRSFVRRKCKTCSKPIEVGDKYDNLTGKCEACAKK